MSPTERSQPMTAPSTATPDPSRGLAGHDTDSVGFFFGTLFLVCAAVAIALRTVPLGDSTDGGVAVAAAAVVLTKSRRVTRAFSLDMNPP